MHLELKPEFSKSTLAQKEQYTTASMKSDPWRRATAQDSFWQTSYQNTSGFTLTILTHFWFLDSLLCVFLISQRPMNFQKMRFKGPPPKACLPHAIPTTYLPASEKFTISESYLWLKAVFPQVVYVA